MIDKHKICFIICINDEQQLQECIMYLSLLHIPEGYQTDVITVADASSMTSGYNEAMRASDAKYKIYLHQDTFIVEPDFLDYLLKLFKRDSKIGMIGIVGAEKLSKDGVMWHGQRCGNFYKLKEFIKDGFDNIVPLKRGYKEVEAIDGLLMATQYDLPWREDIFKDFDFYDVSQCIEFRRAGYKIVVPAQKANWVIHDCGVPNQWHYNKNREILLGEYPEIVRSQKDKKRILFLHSIQIQSMGIPYALTEMGHSVEIPEIKITLENGGKGDLRDQEIVEELLEDGNYDLVVTYDFSQGTSSACQNFRIPYYAWVYDSPLLGLYSREALNEVNYISVFDKKQYERLKDLGLRHLFYMPLAPETDNFGVVHVGKRDEKKYTCDVSFVGRLYNNRGFEEIFDETGKTYLEEAEKIINEMDCGWGKDVTIFDKASEELIHYMASKQPEETWKAWNVDKRYYCESMKLVRKCNEVERIKILERLQDKFSIVVYADDSAKNILKNVRVEPWLEYGTEMPKVFYLSKINLNITSRSIESGIPLRVWDILAVGGFCLTNYQPELEDYFEIGKDLEVYHDLKELEEKIAYYLKHEDERVRIAVNGYKKVKREHGLNERMQSVLDLIFTDSAARI